MEIEVRDVAKEQGGGGSFYGGPPVALQVIVQQRDLRRAMAILREKMGLFPGQEVEVADEAIDDGTTTVLGAFGHRSDAEDVARVLEEAGIWNRIAANSEGRVEDEDCVLAGGERGGFGAGGRGGGAGDGAAGGVRDTISQVALCCLLWMRGSNALPYVQARE